jgi:hypothetical protein
VLAKILAGVVAVVILMAAQLGRTQTGPAACQGIATPATPYAHETITVSNVAIGFTVPTMVVSGSGPSFAVV